MTPAELSTLAPLPAAWMAVRASHETTGPLPLYVNHLRRARDEQQRHWWLIGYSISAYPTNGSREN